MTHDLKMPGDYEYRALHSSNIIQRQWNKNRILFLRHIKFFTKQDIALDAGCGSGNVVLAFSKSAKKIEGWDINPNSVKFLKTIIKKRHVKNAGAKVQDLLTISGKEVYTKVTLTEVIEHFAHQDYSKMLKKLNKVMKKNGKIFITTPNDKSIWPLLDFFLNGIQRYIQKVPTFHERHLGHFDTKRLTRDVEKAGFKIERIGTMNAFSPFLFFLPEKTRDTLCVWESKHVSFGPLLYVVAEKK